MVNTHMKLFVDNNENSLLGEDCKYCPVEPHAWRNRATLNGSGEPHLKYIVLETVMLF